MKSLSSVSGMAISVSWLRNWGLRVLKRGGDTDDFGPHSRPHCKELATSTVVVAAEHLEHYQACQWLDRKKDCSVHDDLQVGQ